MTRVKRKCDTCNKEYQADSRNIKRGWGLCCSKSCAAKKREKSKPSYNKQIVKQNNIRRKNWNIYFEREDSHFLSYDGADNDQWGDCDFGFHE